MQRNHTMTKSMFSAGLFVATATAALMNMACGASTPPPTTVTPANYAYSMPSTVERNGIALGVLNPVFADWNANELDDGDRALQHATAQGFFELLVNKGFNASGPFGDLASMTFPEKRQVSLLIQAEFHITTHVTPRQVSVSSWNGSTTCTLEVNISGNTALIAIEPLSNQRMWNKRIDLTLAPTTTERVGDAVWCSGARDNQPPAALRNAWARAYESVYQQTMAGLDRFINVDEFRVLDTEVTQLRAQTNFGGH